MKKISFIFLFFCSFFLSKAQYRRKYQNNDLQCPSKKNTIYLKKEVGLSAATPWRALSSTLDNIGAGLYFYPRVEFSEIFSAGLKAEVVKMRGFNSDVNMAFTNYSGLPIPAGVQKANPSPLFSLSLMTDIKIPTKSIAQPFIGGGCGYYYINNATLKNVAGKTVELPLAGAIGLNAYIGLELRQFRASANFHILRENKTPMTNLDYVSLNIGYIFEREKKHRRKRYY